VRAAIGAGYYGLACPDSSVSLSSPAVAAHAV
jgi:hypothetical protein